jgi:hypothetical protein
LFLPLSCVRHFPLTCHDLFAPCHLLPQLVPAQLVRAVAVVVAEQVVD